MHDFIFDVPWWLITILLIDGVGLFLFANRRLNTALRNIAAGQILLTLLWVLASFLVDTDLERVEHHTRDLIQRVVAQDDAGIRHWLHPRATAGSWNADQIVRGAVYYARTFGVTKARILSLSPQRRGREISAHVSVFTEQSGYPLTHTWQLDWQSGPDRQWKLRLITPLQIGGASREDIERRYLEQPVAP